MAPPRSAQPVEQWRVTPIVPYRKCYGIDPEEFSAFHNARRQRDFHGLSG